MKMSFCFAATTAALVALACADVRHLGTYNYPLQHTYGQSPTRAQIESIKSSVPLGSFTIYQYIGSQGDSGAYNFNVLQEQHFLTPVQPQSYTAPSARPVQRSFSAPAERCYSPPALDRHRSVAPVQQPSLSAVTRIPLQHFHQALPVAAVQATFSSPASAHQQLYSAPAGSSVVQQQSLSAHGLAPVQQTDYSSAVVQQQGDLLSGQVQEQSFELPGHQQQSFVDVDSTSSACKGAYNYQPTVQQQDFSTPVPAPVQQKYSVPANVQQQSFSTSANKQGGNYNYQSTVAGQQSYSGTAAAPVQHSFSAPATDEVHQTITDSLAVQTGSYNYQPPSHEQQQYTGPVQQTQSVPDATPVQLAGLASIAGVDTGAFNYPTSASAPAISPVSALQGAKYSVPALQKISSLAPVTDSTAPLPNYEVGTVYGQNGGYVYNKF